MVNTHTHRRVVSIIDSTVHLKTFMSTLNSVLPRIMTKHVL